MAHKTLIGGTAYEVSGGKALVNSTAYNIAGGKTLVGGTAYDISFFNGPAKGDFAGFSYVSSAETSTTNISYYCNISCSDLALTYYLFAYSNGSTGVYDFDTFTISKIKDGAITHVISVVRDSSVSASLPYFSDTSIITFSSNAPVGMFLFSYDGDDTLMDEFFAQSEAAYGCHGYYSGTTSYVSVACSRITTPSVVFSFADVSSSAYSRKRYGAISLYEGMEGVGTVEGESLMQYNGPSSSSFNTTCLVRSNYSGNANYEYNETQDSVGYYAPMIRFEYGADGVEDAARHGFIFAAPLG